MELSIIIPIYNGEKYLEECLNSVFSTMENNNNIEVIIIDDGSTDNSSQIYEQFKYENLVVKKIQNHGVSYARNYGLKLAQGKYIMFVDCDDVLSSGWEKIIKKLLCYKYDIVYFINNMPENVERKMIIDNILKVSSEYGYLSIPCSRIFKREFLEKNNILFDEEIINGEDMIFNLEAILKAQKYIICNESIYNYRINYISTTKTFSDKFFNSDKKFQIRIKEILEKFDLEINKYSNFLIANAIKMFIYKMTMLSDMKEYQKYIEIFEEEPYKSFLKNYRVDLKKVKNDIILYLVKLKKYKLAISLIKIKTKYKRKNILKEEQFKLVSV